MKDDLGQACAERRTDDATVTMGGIAIAPAAGFAGPLGISGQVLLIWVGAILALLFLGAMIARHPKVKGRLTAGQSRATVWLTGAIAAWERDGRVSAAEADRLRGDIADPRLRAVLPHLGVHLTIGVFLRFPIGSITRAGYVVSQMLLSTGRLLTRRIDHHAWREAMGIHSPLVLALTCLPGIGTFAYLTAKPIRSHHLLVRVALDAVLLRLPARVYERLGLRWVIARTPANATATVATAPDGRQLTGITLSSPPQRLAVLLGLLAVGLLAADLIMQTADAVLKPTIVFWDPLLRIFDMDSETSIGTWVAVVTMLLCATILAVIAIAKSQAGDRFTRHWAVLAVIAFGLSLDDEAKFHDSGGNTGDWARDTFGLGGFLYNGWVIVAAISALIVGISYRRFLFALPSQTRWRLMAAAVLFGAGEAGLDMVSGWLTDQGNRGLIYATVSSVEEFIGLTGMLVALLTLLAYARDHVGEIRFNVQRATLVAPIVKGAGLDEAVREEALPVGAMFPRESATAA